MSNMRIVKYFNPVVNHVIFRVEEKQISATLKAERWVTVKDGFYSETSARELIDNYDMKEEVVYTTEKK